MGREDNRMVLATFFLSAMISNNGDPINDDENIERAVRLADRLLDHLESNQAGGGKRDE
jgi:hypothetical protein